METASYNRESSKLFAHYASSRNDHEKISIEWKDLNYSILAKDPVKSFFFAPVYKNKRILRSMQGKVSSGELLAIMGPTGCGKTSLLNVLAARVSDAGNSGAELTGSITVNGKPRNDDTFRRVSAYVLQDDRLYAHLTVFETLIYSAHFYLPNTVTLPQKEELVTNVISELGLNKTRDTIIGDEKLRGVSGGERKRANIGVQLISDPAVLFLDEPTSGLDSFQAQAVIESMKAIAQHGRLVITVIHQPRSSIFDMFDQLLLLSEGRTVYLGPASGASEYFLSQGHPTPQYFNPADFFLDLLSPDNRSKEAELATGARILKLAGSWATLQEQRAVVKSDAVAAEQTAETTNAEPLEEYGSIKPSDQKLDFSRFVRTVKLLMFRSLSGQLRAPQALIARVVVSIAFGGIIGGMYSNMGTDQRSIFQLTGFLFVIVINQGFNAATAVLATFPREKLIVNRERANRAYDTVTYFFAKFLAELPLNLVPPMLFGVIIYNIPGLPTDKLGMFLLILELEVTAALSMGMLVSAAAATPELALGIGIPVTIISFVFGGFYINVDSLPPVANLLPYVSFMKWTFESFCINQFTGVTFSCTGGATQACLSTGEQVLESLSFAHASLSDTIFGLVMMIIGLLTAGVFVLHQNQLRYTNLGHVGRLKAKLGSVAEADDNTSAAALLLSSGVGSVGSVGGVDSVRPAPYVCAAAGGAADGTTEAKTSESAEDTVAESTGSGKRSGDSIRKVLPKSAVRDR